MNLKAKVSCHILSCHHCAFLRVTVKMQSELMQDSTRSLLVRALSTNPSILFHRVLHGLVMRALHAYLRGGACDLSNFLYHLQEEKGRVV